MVAVAAQCQAFVAGGKVAARQPRAQRTVRVSCQQQGEQWAAARVQKDSGTVGADAPQACGRCLSFLG